MFLLAGCTGPQKHLSRADDVAQEIIASKQQEALGRTEPFTIESAEETLRKRLLETQNLQSSHPASLGRGELEPISHWPDLGEDTAREAAAAPLIAVTDGPIRLTLLEALEIAAASSRDFQDRKENVFQTALVLDLENQHRPGRFAHGDRQRKFGFEFPLPHTEKRRCTHHQPCA